MGAPLMDGPGVCGNGGRGFGRHTGISKRCRAQRDAISTPAFAVSDVTGTLGEDEGQLPPQIGKKTWEPTAAL